MKEVVVVVLSLNYQDVFKVGENGCNIFLTFHFIALDLEVVDHIVSATAHSGTKRTVIVASLAISSPSYHTASATWKTVD